MAATKLTQHLRAVIANESVDYFFGAKIKSTELDRAKVGDEIYLSHPDIIDVIDKLKGIPKAFVCKGSAFTLCLASETGEGRYETMGGKRYNNTKYIQMTEVVSVPQYDFVVVNEGDEKLAAYRAAEVVVKDVYDDARLCKEKIRSMLNANKTVEGVMLAWPEGKEFLQTFLNQAQQVSNLPALTCTEINNLIAKAS